MRSCYRTQEKESLPRPQEKRLDFDSISISISIIGALGADAMPPQAPADFITAGCNRFQVLESMVSDALSSSDGSESKEAEVEVIREAKSS